MILALRGQGVSDNNVLRAMETVPRGKFVESKYADIAYDARSIPIACGQSLPEPLAIAAMTQSAEIQADHKVLEIGTGSGYHTAIIAQLCRRVYSAERYNALVDLADSRLQRLGVSNAVVEHRDGRYGWRGQAPFDRIIVTAGLSAPPGVLFGQLKPYGKLVCVLDGVLTVCSKSKVKVSSRDLFALNLAPLEPGKSKVL